MGQGNKPRQCNEVVISHPKCGFVWWLGGVYGGQHWRRPFFAVISLYFTSQNVPCHPAPNAELDMAAVHLQGMLCS